MPWKIIKAVYETTDRSTLHDDELIALERALRQVMGEPQNEFNPAWRAWCKIRPLACECDGGGDPIDLRPGCVRRNASAPRRIMATTVS